MYTEYQPPRLLAPYIDNYWEFKGTSEYGMRIHILPDDCTDFIFTSGEAVSKVEEETLVMQPYRSYFAGPMTRYSELVTYVEFVYQFGVCFLPYGLSGFAKSSSHGFVGYRVSTDEMQAVFGSTLIERLYGRNNVRGRIQVVEEYLLAYLAHNYQPVDTQVAATANIINQSVGKHSVRSLVDEICLCQYHLGRKFKYNIGFTPKEYSRVVKFKNTIELLRNTIFINLLTIAIDAGYYDLAHFSKEIKALSGNAPSLFLSLTVLEDITLTYVEP